MAVYTVTIGRSLKTSGEAQEVISIIAAKATQIAKNIQDKYKISSSLRLRLIRPPWFESPFLSRSYPQSQTLSLRHCESQHERLPGMGSASHGGPREPLGSTSEALRCPLQARCGFRRLWSGVDALLGLDGLLDLEAHRAGSKRELN